MSSDSDISDEILDEKTESSQEDVPKEKNRSRQIKSATSLRLIDKSFYKTLRNTFAQMRFKKEILNYFDRDNVVHKSRINWCASIQKLKDELKKQDKIRKTSKSDLDKFVKCFDLESMRYVNISECYRYLLACDLDGSASYKFLSCLDELRLAVDTGVLVDNASVVASNRALYAYWNRFTSNKTVSKTLMLARAKRNPFVYLLKQFRLLDTDRKGYVAQSEFVELNRKCGFGVFDDKTKVKTILTGLESLQVLSELDKKLTEKKKINYVNYLTLVFLKTRKIDEVRKRTSSALCMMRSQIDENDEESFAKYFKSLFRKQKYYQNDLFNILVLKLGMPLGIEDIFCMIRTLNSHNIDKTYLRKIMIFDFMTECDLCSRKTLSEACTFFKGLIPSTKINLFIVRCEKAAINSKITVRKFQQIIRLMCTSYEKVTWWKARTKIPFIFVKNLFLVSGDSTLNNLRPLVEYMDQDRENKLKVNLIKKLWKSKFDSVDFINRNEADVSDGEDSEMSEKTSINSEEKMTLEESYATQYSLKDDTTSIASQPFVTEAEENLIFANCFDIYKRYVKQVRNSRLYLPAYALRCSVIDFCSKEKIFFKRILYNPKMIPVASIRIYFHQVLQLKQSTNDKLTNVFSNGRTFHLRKLLLYFQTLLFRRCFDIYVLLECLPKIYKSSSVFSFTRAVRRKDFWFTGMIHEITLRAVLRKHFDCLQSTDVNEMITSFKIESLLQNDNDTEEPELCFANKDKLKSLSIYEVLVQFFVTKAQVVDQEKAIITHVAKIRNLIEDSAISVEQFRDMIEETIGDDKELKLQHIYSLLIDKLKLPFDFKQLGLLFRALSMLNQDPIENGISRNMFVQALYEPKFRFGSDVYFLKWIKNIKLVDPRTALTGASVFSISTLGRQLSTRIQNVGRSVVDRNKNAWNKSIFITAVKIHLKKYNRAINIFGEEYKDLNKFTSEEIEKDTSFNKFRKTVRSNSLFLSNRRLYYILTGDENLKLHSLLSKLLLSSSTGKVSIALLRSEMYSNTSIRWAALRAVLLCFCDDAKLVDIKNLLRYSKSIGQDKVKEAVEQIRAKYMNFRKETGKRFFLKKGSSAKLTEKKLGKLLNFLGLRIISGDGIINQALLRKIIDAFDYDNNGYLNEDEINELFLLHEKSPFAKQLESRLRKIFAVLFSESTYFKTGFKNILKRYSSIENKDFMTFVRFRQFCYDVGMPFNSDDLTFISTSMRVSEKKKLLSSSEVLRFMMGRGKLKVIEVGKPQKKKTVLTDVPEQDYQIPGTCSQRREKNKISSDDMLIHPLVKLRKQVQEHMLFNETTTLPNAIHQFEKEMVLLQINHFKSIFHINCKTLLMPSNFTEKMNFMRARENRFCSFMCNVCCAFNVPLALHEATSIFRIPLNEESIIDCESFCRIFMMYKAKTKKVLSRDIYRAIQSDELDPKSSLVKYLFKKQLLFSHARFDKYREEIANTYSNINDHLSFLGLYFCDENKNFDLKKFLIFTRKFDSRAGKGTMLLASYLEKHVKSNFQALEKIFNSLVVVTTALYLPDLKNFFSCYILCHTSINCWKSKRTHALIKKSYKQTKLVHCIYVTVSYGMFTYKQLGVSLRGNLKSKQEGSFRYTKAYLARIVKDKKIEEVISNTINIKSIRGAHKGFSFMTSTTDLENIYLIIETGETVFFPTSTLLANNDKAVDISTSICFMQLNQAFASLKRKRFYHTSKQPLLFIKNDSSYYLTKNLVSTKPQRSSVRPLNVKNKLYCNLRLFYININQIERISKLVSSPLIFSERNMLKRMAHRLSNDSSLLVTRDHFKAKDILDEYLICRASKYESEHFNKKYHRYSSDMQNILERKKMFKEMKRIVKLPKHTQDEKIKDFLSKIE